MPAGSPEVVKAASLLWPAPRDTTATGYWAVKCFTTPQYPQSSQASVTATVATFNTQGAVVGTDATVNSITTSAISLNTNLPVDQRVTDARVRALDALYALVVAQLPAGTVIRT